MIEFPTFQVFGPSDAVDFVQKLLKVQPFTFVHYSIFSPQFPNNFFFHQNSVVQIELE